MGLPGFTLSRFDTGSGDVESELSFGFVFTDTIHYFVVCCSAPRQAHNKLYPGPQYLMMEILETAVLVSMHQ